MSNHKAWTWDHRESKPLDPKFLPLDHHLDGYGYWFNACIKGPTSISYCFFLEYIFTVKCVFKSVQEFESVSIDI